MRALPIPEKSNSRKEGDLFELASLRILSVIAGSEKGKELEVADDTVSTVRKQRAFGTQLAFYFPFSPEPQAEEQCHPHLGWNFPP